MRFSPIPRRAALAALLLSICLLHLPAALALGVIKSPNDDRLYDAFTLANGLKVLVISDPRADKAAAAMDVAVGSDSDPDDRPGLAHFLEHMLFLGTKKYPQAGEYQAYISAHGGQHNAYTAHEHTNYFFDVDAQYLEPALDRFAQFFIAPLFTPQYVEREKNSVHSEYQAKRKDDGMRLYYAWKQVTSPEHPLSHFDVGSLDTLADRKGSSVRAELIAFYRRHYSANLMALVVLGKEPAGTLRRWVEQKFAAVRNVGAVPRRTTEPLFAPGRLPARLNVTPLQDRRRLALSFPIPPVTTHYRAKPVAYIANLLGHEGQGSLLSALKAKGWVEGLSAGLGVSHRSEATLEVSMRLTEEGVGHVDEIAASVFAYLELIRREGLARWIFEEQQRIAELNFRFREKSSAIHYVSALAHDRQEYPAEDVLRGPYAMDEYDPALIRQYLDRLVPENALLTVNAPGLPTDAKEPWFETPYKISPIGAGMLERWRTAGIDPALAIPAPNPFLPENLAVRAPREATPRPVRLLRDRGLEVWFQQDATFRVPRTEFYFTVRSSASNDTPKDTVLTELYVRVVNDQLNEFSYPAYIAGLDYNLYRHARGISVRISGYSDKQRLLLERIVEALAQPAIKRERFELAKDELTRRLRNAKKETPYRQTLAEVTDLLLQPAWTEDARLAAAVALTPADLEAFVPRLLARIEVVVLAHGNLYNEEALALAAVLKEGLLAAATPASVGRAQVVKLPAGKELVRELAIDHPDSALTVYVQGTDTSYAARAQAMLAAQVLSSPFYNELRTEKQLGYVVFATSMPLLEVPGLAFVVQSPGTGPAELERDVEAFLRRYRDDVARLSAAEFAKHKAALVSRILEQEQNLQARTDRYWTELDQREYQFDSRQRLAQAVRRIAKPDFERFYSELLLGEQRRWLVVRSSGSNRVAAFTPKGNGRPYALVEDIAAFKENASYFAP